MKVRALIALASLCSVSPAQAASATVSDTSAALPGVAQSTTAVLIDAGFKPHHAGSKFFVEAKNFHCDQHSNAALDAAFPKAGLGSLACRTGAKNLKDTKTGKHFGDGRAMLDLLGRIDTANIGPHFSDCASGGYCGTFAKIIKCTINPAIDNFTNGGRWSCEFDDGN